MASATQADYSVTNAWTDLVDTNGATASVDVLLQNKGDGIVQVIFGGTEPSDEDGGLFLKPYDSVQGNAAAIWLRSQGGDAVSVTLL